jgi:hypothetical protein
MKTKLNEDWLAVWLGLFLFALSLATFFGGDALGWAVTTSVWTSPWKVLAPASKAYSLSGPLSLLPTYAFLLALTTIGAKALRLDLRRFVKGFTDVFIGIWAFILAWIWAAKIDPKRGEKVKATEIWQRFPKFVLGCVATFAIILAVGLLSPALVPKAKAAMAQANLFRAIFFVLTFFTIGVVSDFRFSACSVSSSGSGWQSPGSSSTESSRQSHKDEP